VLELLTGQSLAQVMAQDALAVGRAVRITQQVCRALEAAHQVGVVHRDVKPDNLHLIQRAGLGDFVKVLDFGVAKLDTLREARASDTAEGTIVGTPTYMAPEQASGLAVDARTDVYAVGTVLYEMLAGHPPFSGANFGQLAAQVIAHTPPPLPRYTRSGERIPLGLRSLVLRCLEKDPQSRPQSMAELERLLTPYLAPAAIRPRWGRRAVASAAALASLFAVAAVIQLGRVDVPASRVIPTASAAEALSAPSAQGKVAIAPAARSTRQVTAPPRDPGTVVMVKSLPAGAQVVRMDTGEPLGVTPLELRVAEDERFRVRLSMRGHAPAERTVSAEGSHALSVRLGKSTRKSRVRKSSRAQARRAAVDPLAL
jgi:serine/threonine-protein kinase